LPEIPYGFWQKQLHWLVLGSRIVTEFSLDLETGRNRSDPAAVENRRHVFIAGLARSGTTILLRRLYATGAFASLTYRDMPFVLMPMSWKGLWQKSQKSGKKTQRAHGDGLMVDYDSPEAFEEVFWKAACGPDYIRKDGLLPHAPEHGVLEKFKQYIGLVLKSREFKADRYLSKNNNNILRLPALCRALPQSLILVPFRDPAQQAASLLRQHRRFLEPVDGFIIKYMKWLGHYEFGAGHQPFLVSDQANPYDRETLAYWLMLWNQVYQWLLATAPASTVFISYERLCTDNGQTWARLLEKVDAKEALKDDSEPLNLKTVEIEEPAAKDLLRACQGTYDRLLDRHDRIF